MCTCTHTYSLCACVQRYLQIAALCIYRKTSLHNESSNKQEFSSKLNVLNAASSYNYINVVILMNITDKGFLLLFDS